VLNLTKKGNPLTTNKYDLKKMISNLNPLMCITTLLLVTVITQTTGCAPKLVEKDDFISSYQREISNTSPQPRESDEGLESLIPSPEPDVLKLDVSKDEISGKNLIKLSLDDAIKRTLISTPEINIVSYDPSIASEDIVKALADFEPALFGRVNFDQQDDPPDSVFLGGESDSRMLEAGIKQKGITGAEWSLAYALTRNWDDLTTRTLSTRYEPIVSFQIKQPLLRDAWQEVNLAGVNTSQLNYRIALAAFRQKTEEVSTEVIALYWSLARARRDRQIQKLLLDWTIETLKKVENRKGIDATEVQIKQTETALKSREAILFQTEKQVLDVQDALVRLLSDNQINLLSNFEIVPISELAEAKINFKQPETLGIALSNNPVIEQARLNVDITEINIDVARRQKMPKLDLIATTRLSGLSQGSGASHDELESGNYSSYAIGLTFEVPIGNRQREAEYRKRNWEKRKATSILQNRSDQLAAQVKERIRKAETSYEQIRVQKEAVAAAKIYLQAVEDTEEIRNKLTPEFLLVKLQAQEASSNAGQSEIKAIADYNIAIVRLNQAMGTVLDMRYVRNAMPVESNQAN
jgi:outer membrane protein